MNRLPLSVDLILLKIKGYKKERQHRIGEFCIVVSNSSIVLKFLHIRIILVPLELGADVPIHEEDNG